MPPFLKLEPHVSYGLVETRPVFLDLRRDRYFALDGPCTAAFERVVQRGGAASDPTDLERLLSTGLFYASAEPATIEPVRVPVPTRSALETDASGRRPGIRDALGAHVAVRRIRRLLRRKLLVEIVVRERDRRAAARPIDPPDLEDLARRFRAARSLAPGAPVCLPDSLALLDWLAARSAFPALVFGVRLQPFGAHCWVQTDEAILTDAADTVRDFTPVLVIR
jgi:hypothetical protein